MFSKLAQPGRDAFAQPGRGAVSGLPVLHVHDVTVRFSDATVLEDVSFDLEAGCFLAVVGPNGGGKSTLIKVALGLVRPQSGHAALFGEAAGARPERVGYVPQLKTFDRTFPATALELVVTGLRRSWPARIRRAERERGVAALEQVGASQLERRPLARLSGGELQRVYLARALVRVPELVLLDEPAAGVDFLAEHDLHDLLEAYQEHTAALGRKATVVMITHDMSAARYHADKVLVLNRRLMAFGPPDEVLADEELRAAFGHRHHEHAVAP
ncbi:MAG TPA: metal ABC transporter ATP-binding protein [Trueperaceae bacterium]|nr:metal ABC transporter ATP-binding protein [Trueperaceae bacterium]